MDQIIAEQLRSRTPNSTITVSEAEAEAEAKIQTRKKGRKVGKMAITLNNGFKMPVVGLVFGAWKEKKSETSLSMPSTLAIAISIALLITRMNQKLGRHLQKHFRLGLLGERISSSPPRHVNFQSKSYLPLRLTSIFLSVSSSLMQLWNSDHGHVVEACKDSLKKLRLDYLDLYLVHFPVATKHTGVGMTGSALDEDGVLEIDTTISLETTWHAMEELVSMGLVRSIGISNYDIFLTRDCLAYSEVKPAVNQIETHPYFQRESLVKFCQKHGLCVTAHTPLGGAVANSEWFGSVSCLDDPVLKNLAEKYKKTAAQVVLRWGIQRNTVVIPKTSKLERLKENFQVFDFELTKEDMDLIAKVDRKHRTNLPCKFWGVDLFE